MKRFAPFVAGLLMLVLTACGLIPAQPVNDPLQIDGQQLDVVFGGGDALAAQTILGRSVAEFQFSNTDDIGIPIGPARVTAPLGFDPSATLDVAGGPEQITLSDLSVTVRVWEGASTFDAAASDARVEVSAEFVGTITLSRVGTGSSYTFDNDVAGLLLLELTGSAPGRFLAIATDGPQTNFGSIELTAGADPDSLAGSTLTVTVQAGEGEVSF